MIKVGRHYYTSMGVDRLASLEKHKYLFTWNKITKQLAFLIISFAPSLQNNPQNSKPLILA
jgi:hypothetical protein